MSLIKHILIFLLLGILSFFSASADECRAGLKQLLQNSNNIHYSNHIHQYASGLNLSDEEFVQKLKDQKITIEDFVKRVRLYKNQAGKADSKISMGLFKKTLRPVTKKIDEFLAITKSNQNISSKFHDLLEFTKDMTLGETQKFYQQVMLSYRLKLMMNKELNTSLLVSNGQSNLSLLLTHNFHEGLAGTINLVGNMGAFSLIEVKLMTSSVTDAAYLVAHPEIMNQFKNVSVNESEARFAKKLASHIKNLSTGFANNFKELAPTSFGLSLVPTLIGHSLTSSSLEEAMLKSALDSLMISSFISISSNARYQIIFNEVMPLLQSKIKHPLILKAATTGIVLTNTFIGAYTYNLYSSEIKKLLKIQPGSKSNSKEDTNDE